MQLAKYTKTTYSAQCPWQLVICYGSKPTFKDDVKSVLRIGSVHNKGGFHKHCPNFAPFTNFSDIKLCMVYNHLRAQQTRTDRSRYLVT